MSSRWPLTLALASIEPEIWSTTPFAAVGTIAPVDGGLLRFERHSPAVTAANALHPDDFQPGRAVDRTLAAWQLGPLMRVPIEGTGATLFAALPASRQPQDEDTTTLSRLSQQIASRLQAGESEDDREQRLVRIDALSDVLRTLTGVLDLRDVFDQLSKVAQHVLPHDSAFALLFTRVNDQTRIRLHAISAPATWKLPEVVDNPYPEEMTEGWDFAVHPDMSVDPTERNQPAARLGLKSSLRLPIWIDGRVTGAVIFSSFQPNRYTVRDVPIGRRIADYVTLALSHQQLADNARDAAAVRERAVHLEMLDGLLKTLSGVLDVREVFDRVSQVCDKVMTHDAMSISIPSDDMQLWTIHVASGALGHIVPAFVL